MGGGQADWPSTRRSSPLEPRIARRCPHAASSRTLQSGRTDPTQRASRSSGHLFGVGKDILFWPSRPEIGIVGTGNWTCSFVLPLLNLESAFRSSTQEIVPPSWVKAYRRLRKSAPRCLARRGGTKSEYENWRLCGDPASLQVPFWV